MLEDVINRLKSIGDDRSVEALEALIQAHKDQLEFFNVLYIGFARLETICRENKELIGEIIDSPS